MGKLTVKCKDCGTKEERSGVYRENVDKVEKEMIEKHEEEKHGSK